MAFPVTDFGIFSLEDLLQNAKKQETVEVLVNIERVRGLIWTVVQRKKFLQHLETKKAMEKRARTGLCKYHYILTSASHFAKTKKKS